MDTFIGRVSSRPRKRAFLEAFRTTNCVVHAARATGIHERRHYVWLEKDPEYRRVFDTEIRPAAAATLSERASAQADAIAAERAAAQAAAQLARAARKTKKQKKGRYHNKADKQQRAARRRDGYKCVICGFSIATHVHHIVSREVGGSNALSNLITLCPNDHALADRGTHTRDQLRALIA